MIITNIIVSIVLYLVLILLSVNLIGLLVRGLFINPELEKLKSETEYEYLKEVIEKSENADKAINVIAFLLITGYLYATFYFWNIGVTAIAVSYTHLRA